VEFFFRVVGGGKRPTMAGIFAGAGPTEQYFMGRISFFTGHIFAAGNSVCRAQNGLNERSLRAVE
jgi:hypothetical protein